MNKNPEYLIGKEFYAETKEGIGIYLTPIEYIADERRYLCQRIRDDLALLFDAYLTEEEILKLEEV